VSDPADSVSTQPGWYADPSGLPRQRWWDGAQWTEHLHDPSLEKYGVTPAKVLGPETRVYNAFIWLITGLPLLSILAVSSWDVTAYVERSRSEVAALDTGYLLIQLLNFTIYAVSVLLAFADRRSLARDGFVRPFHWAWTFLSSAAYVVGRSVVVNRRAGRGLWPIGAMAAVIAVSIGVAVAKFMEFMALMPALMSTVPVY